MCSVLLPTAIQKLDLAPALSSEGNQSLGRSIMILESKEIFYSFKDSLFSLHFSVIETSLSGSKKPKVLGLASDSNR